MDERLVATKVQGEKFMARTATVFVALLSGLLRSTASKLSSAIELQICSAHPRLSVSILGGHVDQLR